MVHNDVLGFVEVAGQQSYIRSCELVCTVDGFILTICPVHSILGWDKEKNFVKSDLLMAWFDTTVDPFQLAVVINLVSVPQKQ